MPLRRSLRLLSLVGLAGLLVAVVLSLLTAARLQPAAAATQPASGSASEAIQIVQHGTDVEIVRSRAGTPTLRLAARESRTLSDGRVVLDQVVCRLLGPGQKETIVEAPLARSVPPEAGPSGMPIRRSALDESAGGWELEGGVIVRGPDALMLASRRLSYSETDAVARTDEQVSFQRGEASGSARGLSYDVSAQVARFDADVSAEIPMGSMGRVRVTAASARHDLPAGLFEMIDYRAATQRGETLAGGRLIARFGPAEGIRRLEGDGRFTLESAKAIRTSMPSSPLSRLLALEGTRTLRGDVIAIDLDELHEPVAIEVTGEARLTASEPGAQAAPASIAAQTLRFELVDGNLSAAHAAGSVDLQGAPATGETAGFRLRTNNLDAAIDPNLGSILNLEGQGQIVLSDEGMQSEGSRTFMDPNADVVTLTGEKGSPAVATWLGRRIQADRIEADRRKKTLTAHSGVRASYTPRPEQGDAPAEGRALPFFRQGEPIHVMAGRLTLAEQGRVARYSEGVRLWQGDNRLDADDVDVNEKSGTVAARGNVTSSFRQQAAEGAAPTPAPPAGPHADLITVAAEAMTYDRAAGTVVYRGAVTASQATMRVLAEQIIVSLGSDGGSAERMEASGKVELRDQGRRGQGDHLTVDLVRNTLKLSGRGREAIVQDETGQQVVRGISLTMDRSGDRILVESELGGRTWITLKPRQKGAPGVGSDSRD